MDEQNNYTKYFIYLHHIYTHEYKLEKTKQNPTPILTDPNINTKHR